MCLLRAHVQLHVSKFCILTELSCEPLRRLAITAFSMSLNMNMQCSSKPLTGTSRVASLRPRSHARLIGCRSRTTPLVRAIVQEQTPQQAGTKEAENQLEALKAISLVVADTGEIDSIRKYLFRVAAAASHL